MQDKREIPATVNEKTDKVLKFLHFQWGYISCNGSGEKMNKQILNSFSSWIDEVSFNRNSMCLGLVLLFTCMHMCTHMLQNDVIMLAD